MIGSFALLLLHVVAQTEVFLHFVCFTSAKNRQGWLLLSLQVTVQSQAHQFLGKPIQDVERDPLVSLNLSTVCLQQPGFGSRGPCRCSCCALPRWPSAPCRARDSVPRAVGSHSMGTRGQWTAMGWNSSLLGKFLALGNFIISSHVLV